MVKFSIAIFSALLLASPLFAQDLGCQGTPQLAAIADAFPALYQSPVTDVSTCFDPKMYQNNKPLLEDYKLLDVLGLIDPQGCLKSGAREGDQRELVARFIEKNLANGELKVVAKVDPVSHSMAIVYTNSSDVKFSNQALTRRDKWHIAGTTVGGIVLGALMSETLYKGQADKRKHWIVGAAITGVTSGTAYLVLEEFKLADSLGLTHDERKKIIAYSGPLMSMVVGIAKEVLYDRQHRNKHTVDANDAAATALGGSIVTPLLLMNIKF